MKTIKVFCILFLLTVGMVESALRLVDPLGARYYNDLEILETLRQPFESGYTFGDGIHELTRFSFAYGNNARITPDSAPGQNVIFVGDSVTFGLGVENSETWVNNVASRLNIHAINRARPAYNIGNIEREIDLFQGVCIVYLVVNNDHETDATYTPVQPKRTPLFTLESARYIDVFMYMFLSPVGKKPDRDFYQRIEDLADNPRVLVLAFDERFSAPLSEDIYRIPRYRRSISFFDGHPSAAGNIEIADSVTPVIEKWLGLDNKKSDNIVSSLLKSGPSRTRTCNQLIKS